MLEARLYKVDQQMAKPFGHAALKRECADSIVLVLQYGKLWGMGECAPRAYVTGESSEGVLEAATRVDMTQIGVRIFGTSPSEVVRLMFEEGASCFLGLQQEGNNLACLFELAVLDLLARREGCSVARLIASALNWSEPVTESGEIPFSHVLDFSTDGCRPGTELVGARVIKIKADADVGRTVSSAQAVREVAGKEPLLIIDANMSWDMATAFRHAEALVGLGVGLYEEPLTGGDLVGASILRRTGGMSVMLDESLCSLSDAQRAVVAGACDAFNIRVAKCGGLLNSVRLIRFAREHGIRYQIGVQVAEVGPLIQAERQLALLCPGFLTMEAGQHDRFFSEMVVAPIPLINRPGHLIVISPVTGLGVQPTPLLDYFSCSCGSQAKSNSAITYGNRS